jgi:peptidoglycan-N-acetylglucosamine deacetylase
VRIALTFDDGPAVWTESILDTLASSGARATFFVVGLTAEGRPDIVKRIVGDGHELGNHTWSHPRLATECDDGQVRTELERTNELLRDVVGLAPSRFRAPRYDVDERVIAIASMLGLSHTHGDVTPPDWDSACTTPFIVTFVLQQARHGAVIGLHDGVAPGGSRRERSQQATADAVARFVPELAHRGFEVVTASELLGESNGPESTLGDQHR